MCRVGGVGQAGRLARGHVREVGTARVLAKPSSVGGLFIRMPPLRLLDRSGHSPALGALKGRPAPHEEGWVLGSGATGLLHGGGARDPEASPFHASLPLQACWGSSSQTRQARGSCSAHLGTPLCNQAGGGLEFEEEERFLPAHPLRLESLPPFPPQKKEMETALPLTPNSLPLFISFFKIQRAPSSHSQPAFAGTGNLINPPLLPELGAMQNILMRKDQPITSFPGVGAGVVLSAPPQAVCQTLAKYVKSPQCLFNSFKLHFKMRLPPGPGCAVELEGGTEHQGRGRGLKWWRLLYQMFLKSPDGSLGTINAVWPGQDSSLRPLEEGKTSTPRIPWPAGEFWEMKSPSPLPSRVGVGQPLVRESLRAERHHMHEDVPGVVANGRIGTVTLTPPSTWGCLPPLVNTHPSPRHILMPFLSSSFYCRSPSYQSMS
ncbi:hypothetical protein L345_02251, partial [Ophiophagus hannah]